MLTTIMVFSVFGGAAVVDVALLDVCFLVAILLLPQQYPPVALAHLQHLVVVVLVLWSLKKTPSVVKCPFGALVMRDLLLCSILFNTTPRAYVAKLE